MSILITILISIFMFGILIFIHEFGHFITAKLCNIKVNEFAIGMGPTLLKKQKGETKYALRAFPIGGFVSMEGEDEESTDNRAFNNKSIPKRFLVLIAGAAMNILLGIIITFIIVCMQSRLATTEIAYFEENALTHQTGLEVGDTILKVDNANILSANDLIYSIMMDEDGVVNMLVRRNGEKVLLENVSFQVEPSEEHEGINNIIFDFKVVGAEKTVGTVLKSTAIESISTAKTIWRSLIDILRGRISVNELSGPIGVATTINTAINQGAWLSSVLSIVAFISINLGIFNLLPFPALDGGRIVFLLIEAIRRKPIDRKYEGYVNFIGFALLMILMVFVLFKDIISLF